MLCVNAPIPDGVYDAFVVDAHARDTDMSFSLTITTGAEKGSIVDVIGQETRDEVSLIGLPCMLVVEDGVPRIEWE